MGSLTYLAKGVKMLQSILTWWWCLLLFVGWIPVYVIGRTINKRAKKAKEIAVSAYIPESRIVDDEKKKAFVKHFVEKSLTEEETRAVVLDLKKDLEIFLREKAKPRESAEVNLIEIIDEISHWRWEYADSNFASFMDRAFKLCIVALALGDTIPETGRTAVASWYAVYRKTKDHVWDLHEAYILAVATLLVKYDTQS